jgi:hypothetical protein
MLLTNINKSITKHSFCFFCKNTNFVKTTDNISIFKIQRKHLYYDTRTSVNDNSKILGLNNIFTRNIDFVFNLGYNTLSELIETNISLFRMFSLIRNKKLNDNIKNHYIDLLEAIEIADVNVLDEILEKNFKFVLYNDLVKYSKKNYSIKIKNKKSPIDIRFLAFNELYNIEIDREKNLITDDFVIAPFRRNKFILANENTYKIKETKTVDEIEIEKKIFEKSDFKTIAYNHFTNGLRDRFKVEYCRKKLKQSATDDDIQYLVSIMSSLDKTEFNNDQYSIHIKNEFADYYTMRDKFIKEKKDNIDLYLYFKENMPNQYKTFFERNSNKSFFKNIIVKIKKGLFDKVINPRKYIFGKKSIQVIDVEISSKMRIEIFDENGQNIQYSKFNYGESFDNKSKDNKIDENINGDYDKNYIFDIPKWKWDLNHEDFIQKHLLRIEFEKLNKKLFTSRNVYKTLKITDIDLGLNGNKHYRLVKSNNLSK